MRVLAIKSKTYGTKEVYYDDEDHEKISQFVWCLVPNRNTFYAMSRIKLGYKKYKTVRMHQLVISSKYIDHRDGNGLKNVRSNLRPSTTQQNNCNVGLTKRNKTGYKGVHKCGIKYRVSIRKCGLLIDGGLFKTAKEAAEKYNQMAIIHHGDFAWLNPL